ncbi:hypothetical protein D3C84_880700 [compost metagenome]
MHAKDEQCVAPIKYNKFIYLVSIATPVTPVTRLFEPPPPLVIAPPAKAFLAGYRLIRIRTLERQTLGRLGGAVCQQRTGETQRLGADIAWDPGDFLLVRGRKPAHSC